MMLYLILYLNDLYTSALVAMCVLIAVFFIISLYGMFIMDDNKGFKDVENGKSWEMKYKEEYHFGKKLFNGASKAVVIFAIIFALMPSKQTVTIASGLYIGTSIYAEYKNSPLVDKAVRAVNKELDTYLDNKAE
nr:MAG TPA: hypothetical protein [Caudoviricetes sp.]